MALGPESFTLQVCGLLPSTTTSTHIQRQSVHTFLLVTRLITIPPQRHLYVLPIQHILFCGRSMFDGTPRSITLISQPVGKHSKTQDTTQIGPFVIAPTKINRKPDLAVVNTSFIATVATSCPVNDHSIDRFTVLYLTLLRSESVKAFTSTSDPLLQRCRHSLFGPPYIPNPWPQ